MDRSELHDRFNLDEDVSSRLGRNGEIETVRVVNLERSVTKGEGSLPIDGEPTRGELVGKAGFIRRFEQSGTEGPVNLDRRADDLGRQMVEPLCGASAAFAALR